MRQPAEKTTEAATSSARAPRHNSLPNELAASYFKWNFSNLSLSFAKKQITVRQDVLSPPPLADEFNALQTCLDALSTGTLTHAHTQSLAQSTTRSQFFLCTELGGLDFIIRLDILWSHLLGNCCHSLRLLGRTKNQHALNMFFQTLA